MLPWGNKCESIMQNQCRKAIDLRKNKKEKGLYVALGSNCEKASQNQRPKEIKLQKKGLVVSNHVYRFLFFQQKIHVVVVVVLTLPLDLHEPLNLVHGHRWSLWTPVLKSL